MLASPPGQAHETVHNIVHPQAAYGAHTFVLTDEAIPMDLQQLSIAATRATMRSSKKIFSALNRSEQVFKQSVTLPGTGGWPRIHCSVRRLCRPWLSTASQLLALVISHQMLMNVPPLSMEKYGADEFLVPKKESLTVLNHPRLTP